MKNYDTFKQYMKRLADEYENEPEGIDSFSVWLANLPEPEKKEEERWKPEKDEEYYIPSFIFNRYDIEKMYENTFWLGSHLDEIMYKRGLVCKTKEEAIALAERMLEAIKN